MHRIATILIGFIAALHFYIAWFEIFAWETRGPAVFTTLPVDLFEPTVAMAANQGLYNGFIAVGLVWSLLIKDARWRFNVAACFLAFVAVAGIFGAFTVTPKIFFVQTVPAVTAFVVAYLSFRKSR